jgi:two-component sensor histidine kinase
MNYRRNMPRLPTVCDQLRRSASELRFRRMDDGDRPRFGALRARPLMQLHYSGVMQVPDALAREGAPPALFGWPRVRVALIASTLIGLCLRLGSLLPTYVVVGRTLVVGFAALLVFGIFERWPTRIPGWLARWAVQVLAIASVVPVAAYFAYWLTTGGNPQFATVGARLQGYLMLTFSGILFAPWIAVGALVRQRDAFAREQASAFALERSELERKALDARFRLLQAQVEPHFLFNTLANVQALVDAGAPQASKVLKSLIAYLRAAVPRLHETATTLGEELRLVRAYLEVMHMRMPDRLNFEMHFEDTMNGLQCPPMTLLTLVENAVRHGIDPSELGGNIAIRVWLESSRCLASVTDTGVGLKAEGRGLGTGLASLRERLNLAFGADAQLTLSEVVPHGVRAEVSFPIRKTQA